MRMSAVVLAAAVGAVACTTGESRPTPSPQASVATTEAVPEEPAAEEPDPAAGVAAAPDATPEPSPAGDAAASPSPAASAPASPSPSPSEKTDAEIREETSKSLQTQVDFYAKHVAAQKAHIEKAQLELNDLTNYTFGGRRKQLSEEIEEAQRQIQQAEAKIGELEEQARRAGVRVNRP